MILIASIGLALAACTRPDASRVAPSPAAGPQVAQTCEPPQRTCVACNGNGVFCAPHCPECAPPVAPQPEPAAQAALTCHPPLHACPACNGGGVICASLCPDCPVLEAPRPVPATLALASSTVSCGGTTCN
ncbi:MAG TPA: hypothetical protein VHW23_27035 [Kofleriaceae bacterium]|jgi:hypothetical protein|nr:hypothetical protein [Kofleriaceae bacterium]